MAHFEWDAQKNQENVRKHGVSFTEAQFVFLDKKKIVFEDINHSTIKEKRYYCIGSVGYAICTVRFTYRASKIRIFGAGFWRKERKIYEEENR